MTTPVFVLHGIGNRDARSFASTVDALAAAVGDITAHPVFWGDLGARYDWITHTVPGAPPPAAEVRGAGSDAEADALARFLLGGDLRATAEIRNVPAVPEPVLTAATAALIRGAGGAEETRGDAPPVEAAEVRQAIAENWPRTRWLPLVDDAELLAAVGAAVAGPITDDSATAVPPGLETRGPDVRGFVRRRLEELDRVVGAAFGAAGGRLNSHVRTTVLPGVTQSVGDILVYQRHREKIRDRVRSVIAQVDPELGRGPQRPVDVLAHSLGGVIAVDMATSDDPLWIRRLVTFGSQSPFFHVCDPRGGALAPYTGTAPVQLPASVGAWTNLWEPLDPVAFVAARIFRLHDGSAPDDQKIAHLTSSGLWTHSDYWTLADVARAIRRALA